MSEVLSAHVLPAHSKLLIGLFLPELLLQLPIQIGENHCLNRIDRHGFSVACFRIARKGLNTISLSWVWVIAILDWELEPSVPDASSSLWCLSDRKWAMPGTEDGSTDKGYDD